MFGIYFGKYLQDKGVLTEQQYTDLVKGVLNAKMKLGVLAVQNHWMTEQQADEVNELQRQQDRRFGDIAIEKGYLNEEQMETLLSQQGDQYLICIQLLTEQGYLTPAEIQNYLNLYKKENRLGARDIDALKSGDLDRIIPVFTQEPAISAVLRDYIAVTCRHIVRFISPNLRLEPTERITEYGGDYFAGQELEGEFKLLSGISGEREAVLTVASIYGMEEFAEVDEDSLDAVCEFLNCSNGLYASRLSEDDIELELLPPLIHAEKVRLSTSGLMFKTPLYLNGRRLELIICVNSEWQMLNKAGEV